MHFWTGSTFMMNTQRPSPARPWPLAMARLRTDQRGGAAIEFAFIAAPLAALMIAILQTSLVFFAQQNLETCAEKSARRLLVGSSQQSGKTSAQFKNDVCATLPFFMRTNNCANLMVDVRTATSFSAASVSQPTLTYDSNGNITNSWQYAPGGGGTINVLRVMYIWKVQKAPFDFDLSTMSNNRRLLFATAVFKTEPYDS